MKSQLFKDYISQFFDAAVISECKFHIEFLDKPKSIKEFFNTVAGYMEIVDNPGIPVYMDANIITLLSIAMYELCVKYAKKYQSAAAVQTAGNLYMVPFFTFLKRIFTSADIDLKTIDFTQKVNGFLCPYSYFMLSTIYTKHINFINRPMAIFIQGMHSNPTIKFDVDILEDIIKPIVDSVQFFYVNVFYTDNKDNSIFSYLKTEWRKFDPIAIYNYILPRLKTNNGFETFCQFLWLNNRFGSFLYDIDANGGIVNNHKWQTLLDALWFRLENTADFKTELPVIFGQLFTPMVDWSIHDQSLFIKKDNGETILFPMVRNFNYDNNAIYMKHIFKEVINHRYALLYLGNYFKVIFQDPYILKIRNNKGNDILLEILERNFSPTTRSSPAKSVSYNSPWFDKQNTYSFSESKSYDEYDDVQINKAYFKDILMGLIKTVSRNLKAFAYDDPSLRPMIQNYFLKLFSYKDVLKHLDIDLDNIPGLHKVILNSPVQKSDSRSVEKALTPTMQNNPFQDFTSTDLLKKLTKLYVRSVQSDNRAVNNFDRIVNIRKYFIRKYKQRINYNDPDYDFLHNPDVHKIRNVVKGKELELFYDFWLNTLQKQNLLQVRFIVYYKDEKKKKEDIALDYGGLTRQFLTNVAKQIQHKHFKMIGYSERYIIDSDKTTSDEAAFIGQLLSLFVVNEIYIPFPISLLYLGHLMFNEQRISIEEKFLYFILDLEKKKAEANLALCTMPIDEDYDPCGPDELQRFIDFTYAVDAATFSAFTDNFFDKKVFKSKFASINDKVRIYDLDKLLTIHKLSNEDYKKYIFDKIILRKQTSTDDVAELQYDTIDTKDRTKFPVYTFLEELFTVGDDFNEYYEKCIVDPKLEEQKLKFKDKTEFCKGMLFFWTGVKTILSTEDYKVTIHPTDTEIKAHTCFNELQLPLDIIKTKQDLYNAFMLIFIYDVVEDFGLL